MQTQELGSVGIYAALAKREGILAKNNSELYNKVYGCTSAVEYLSSLPKAQVHSSAPQKIVLF
jgi:hypothetical protein